MYTYICTQRQTNRQDVNHFKSEILLANAIKFSFYRSENTTLYDIKYQLYQLYYLLQAFGIPECTINFDTYDMIYLTAIG